MRRLVSRRETLSTLALGSAAWAASCASGPTLRPAAAAAPMETQVPPALAGEHQVLPLPFAAGSLRGLSERLIASHHDNNYAGAVKNLNRVERELAQITKDTPGFVVAALRERELMFRNSKLLHEGYFGNLGGDGHRTGAVDAALAAAYGSGARWEEQFRATGAGLGGGSGWVVVALELDTGALRTVGSGNHTQGLAAGLPLLVMDMYEHSYQLDYGAAAARYIDAFMANVQWDVVNKRFERAQRAVAALRPERA